MPRYLVKVYDNTSYSVRIYDESDITQAFNRYCRELVGKQGIHYSVTAINKKPHPNAKTARWEILLIKDNVFLTVAAEDVTNIPIT
jgi:hypothetical protein